MPQPSLSTYHPSLGERLQSGFANLLGKVGVDPRYANHVSQRALGFLNDLTPVGNATMAADAGTAIRNGHPLQGLGMGALAVLPSAAGRVAKKGAQKIGRGMFGRTLEFPSQLNRPRNPTIEEMRQLSSVADVPLEQARLGNKLVWDQFGKVSPLFDEYADKPIAARLRNGEYVLVDGNHRTARAFEQGQASLPMYVIPAERYDPSNAGLKPAKPPSSEELNALLAELLRP